jgi:exodeoxyribonuclease VII small subunit
MSLDTDPAEPFSYGAALTELEAIIEALDDDRLDVDTLAQRVERAAVLISQCRERLDATKLQVSQIIDAVPPPRQ